MSDVKLVAYSDRLRTAVDRIMGAQATSVAGSTKRPGRSTFTDRGGASGGSEYNGYFKIVDASETTTSEDGAENTVFKIAVVDGSESMLGYAGYCRLYLNNEVFSRSVEEWRCEDVFAEYKNTSGYIVLLLRCTYNYDGYTAIDKAEIVAKFVPASYETQYTIYAPANHQGVVYLLLGYVYVSAYSKSLSVHQKFTEGIPTLNAINAEILYSGACRVRGITTFTKDSSTGKEKTSLKVSVVKCACTVNGRSMAVASWHSDELPLEETKKPIRLALRFFSGIKKFDGNGNVTEQEDAKVEVVDLAKLDPPRESVPSSIGEYAWMPIGSVWIKQESYFSERIYYIVVEQELNSALPNLNWYTHCGFKDEEEV